MGRKRDRYVVTGDFKVNGVDLSGQVLIDFGPCLMSGSKATHKADKTHRRFQFASAKDANALGLSKDLREFVIAEKHVSVFLTKQEES